MLQPNWRSNHSSASGFRSGFWRETKFYSEVGIFPCKNKHEVAWLRNKAPPQNSFYANTTLQNLDVPKTVETCSPWFSSLLKRVPVYKHMDNFINMTERQAGAMTA